ncbi:hypothetical protein ACOME3_008486 [Neoechinorhynchus agilis]
MVKIEAAQLALLKSFVELCKEHSEVLHQPELSFFADWIKSFGGVIPQQAPRSESKSESSPPEMEEIEEVEESSPLELEDIGGVIKPDTIDDSLPMGDLEKEVSEEIEDQSAELRSKAQSAGTPEESVKLLSEAIVLNPHSAVLFAKRAQFLVQLKRPLAAIRDCSRALELNENSAAALKWRGRSHRLLGQWAEAYADFCKAQRIDFDDQVAEWANELAEYARNEERKAEERREKERIERVKQAQEAQRKAREAAEKEANVNDFADIFQDPEVMAAMIDISKDPSKIKSYAKNPKIMKLISEMNSKYGTAFQGFSGAAPGNDDKPDSWNDGEDTPPSTPSSKPPQSADDLD